MTGDPLARGLWLTAVLLALAVLAVLGLRLWPLLHPTISVRAAQDRTCDAREGPCTVRFASGGTVTLDLLPRGIPSLTPLTASARLTGLPTPGRVEIDFAGADMNMGYNRVLLTATGAPGRYAGPAMLPVCVRERMLWDAQVLLHYPDRLLAAPFRFRVERQ